MRLKGKNAIVTGSARGLGASIAADLAREGARVMLCDVLDDLGREVAASIGEAAAEAAFGSVDVLVNNAAMVEFATFDELTEEVFKSVFEVNAIGTFLGMKAVVPAMRRAGGGSIVNISSTAGVHSSGGAPIRDQSSRSRGSRKPRPTCSGRKRSGSIRFIPAG
jgi:3alpha(or 20beta)-hydroxysteroid dehydrogenase